MAFSPFCRFRNFTVDNLKALLEIYPDMANNISWSVAAELIEINSKGYKKTSYQQACQFGLEDRGTSEFRTHKYLYSFDDENLLKYIKFWLKTYYAPNPYVNSNDKSILIYCELAKEILNSESHSIKYNDFFNTHIGGKSDDILLNTIKNYGFPIKYRKENDKDILYIDSTDQDGLKKEIDFIEINYPIGDSSSRKEFFDRYSFENYCKFYGIKNELRDSDEETVTTGVKRATGASNILLYGVPGAGKSHIIKKYYCSDVRFMERVVFHPDYTYSDFVGQILPQVVKEENQDEGKLKYVFTPGPFTKVLKKAENDPGNVYYLVIEELNRGNAPSIFGEIFQLLDRKEEGEYSYDIVGESEFEISNYDIALAVYGDENHPVKIPSNMYILATMNTSDQNVFTLDTAFQRRWEMKHIKNNVLEAKHANEKIEGTNISWGIFAKIVNELVIETNADIGNAEDKRLGAYFAKRKELVSEKFPEKVLRYLWDDVFKMEKDSLFKEDYKSLDRLIHDYESTNSDRLETVLRADVYKKMLVEMRKQNNEKRFDAVIEVDVVKE